jgi:hypothetical protein
VTRQFEVDYNTIPWQHKLERALHIAMMWNLNLFWDRLCRVLSLVYEAHKTCVIRHTHTHFSDAMSQVFLYDKAAMLIPKGRVILNFEHTGSAVHRAWRLVYCESTLRWAMRVANNCARVQCDVTLQVVCVVHSRTGSAACLPFIIGRTDRQLLCACAVLASWVVATITDSWGCISSLTSQKIIIIIIGYVD